MNNNEDNNVNVTSTGINPVSDNQVTNPPVENNQPVTPPVNNQVTVKARAVAAQDVDNSLAGNGPKPVAEAKQPVETREERLKRIENNYKPPSKIKIFLLVTFFIILIVFVLFLPEISTMIKKYQTGELNAEDQKIVDGRLVCELTTNSTNLTYEHVWKFTFSDNKLNTLYYKTKTSGDKTEDEKTLDEMANKCSILSKESEELNGVSVTCEYDEGQLIEIQNFEYASVDDELLSNAYIEAGGNKPTYQNLQDMDTIERDLNAQGAKCKRES